MIWFKQNPLRFECEILLLKKYYPNTRIRIERVQLTIYHKVIGYRDKYLARIIYPDCFPYRSLKAYIIKPRLPKVYEKIHRFEDDGSLCLVPPDQMGPQISGKVFCDWINDWVVGYEIWLKTKVFPDGR